MVTAYRLEGGISEDGTQASAEGVLCWQVGAGVCLGGFARDRETANWIQMLLLEGAISAGVKSITGIMLTGIANRCMSTERRTALFLPPTLHVLLMSLLPEPSKKQLAKQKYGLWNLSPSLTCQVHRVGLKLSDNSLITGTLFQWFMPGFCACL